MLHDLEVDSADALPPLPALFRASVHGPDSRETRRISRGAASADFVIVHPGVGVRSVDWAGLRPRERHRLHVRAAAGSLRPRLVASHRSAAAIHGLRMLGPWPKRVHFIDPLRTSDQAWSRVVKHAGPLDDCEIEVVDGVRVTTLARTLVDLALTERFAGAVIPLDGGLRRAGVSTESLLDLVAARAVARGVSAARAAIEFASPQSDSGGESWCRCRLLELGAPTPELQHVFGHGCDRVGPVDFWWEKQGVVLEFDGVQKYLDERFRNGLSADEVVVHERRRERRILARPEVRDVRRAEWGDVVDIRRLRRQLVEAGVPVK
ncbi:hypothetical protein [Frondihabitans australicus]|uniref:Transcriptional regulator, AbiEi antitoxin, Type IV TA system n=1 Tax=Frondihabitans australicus TaxID=386892 RepID=A0A495IEZ3_9MICO|nr:hypothetical protein [Frondihabitans australicus]RKR73586.1 hypothetical protein C8E83_0679 [Frondihabitans australicus]